MSVTARHFSRFNVYLFENIFPYGRKSRGNKTEKDYDGFKDLERQRKKLNEFNEDYNMSLKLVEEIGSGDDLDQRKVFAEFMRKIESGEWKYDAIWVKDIDRLGRWDTLRLIVGWLQKNNIAIISNDCDHIYFPNNPNDKEALLVKNFVADLEYNKIQSRLVDGKNDSFELGNWVNSDPPFPYTYNPVTKGLDCTEKDVHFYKEALNLFLKGVSYDDIGRFLSDENGIMTYRGKKFRGKTVRNMITSHVHLGINIVKGYKHKATKKYIKLPEDKWKIVGNDKTKWKALKSHKEQDLIHKELLRRMNVNRKQTNSIHSLSTLIKCGKCGKTMTVFLNPRGEVTLRACMDRTNEVKCGNKGGKAGIVENLIYDVIEDHIEELKKVASGAKISLAEHKVKARKKKISESEKEIEELKMMVEGIKRNINMGNLIYKTQKHLLEAVEERDKAESKIEELEETIRTYKEELLELENSNSDTVEAFENKFKNLKEESNSEKRNLIYKQFVNKVIWLRESDNNLTVQLVMH